MCDLKVEQATLGLELSDLDETLRNCSFINGPQVYKLEDMIADFVNLNHHHNNNVLQFDNTNKKDKTVLERVFDCVTCANGTDALEIILRCISDQSSVSKDKQSVLTSNFSFIASASCVKLAGIPNVQFYDIKGEKGEYNCDVTDIMNRINPNTIAVIVVSLFGHPAELEEVYYQISKYNKENNLNIRVVEDAAQSFGAPISCSVADFSSISFYPSKVLGAYGDGGAIICKKKYTNHIRCICNHGVNKEDKYNNNGISYLGRNSRLDTFQACILLKKMNRISDIIQSRTQVAQMYTKAFEDLTNRKLLYTPTIIHKSIFAQYTIQLNNRDTRDSLKVYLNTKGIQSQVFYPSLFSDNPIFQSNTTGELGAFACAREKADTVLSIPIYAYMPLQKTQYVIDNILAFFK